MLLCVCVCVVMWVLKFILIELRTLVSTKEPGPSLSSSKKLFMSVEEDIEILLSYAGNCNNRIPINETLQIYTPQLLHRLARYNLLNSDQLCCSDIYCFQRRVTLNAVEENFQKLVMFSLLWNTEYFFCTQYVLRCGTANIRYRKYSTNQILRICVEVGGRKIFRRWTESATVFEISQILENYTNSL